MHQIIWGPKIMPTNLLSLVGQWCGVRRFSGHLEYEDESARVHHNWNYARFKNTPRNHPVRFFGESVNGKC